MGEREASELVSRASTHVENLEVSHDTAIRKFEVTAFARALDGRRNDLTLIRGAAIELCKEIENSPITIGLSSRISTDRNPTIRLGLASLTSQVETNGFGETSFSVRARHYVFDRRRIYLTNEVSPFAIRYHAIKRLAERLPVSVKHTHGLLEYLRRTLPFLVTVSSSAAIATDLGRLPEWTKMPLPVDGGVFVASIEPFSKFAQFDQVLLSIGKHGYTILPVDRKGRTHFIQIRTFIGQDMMTHPQSAAVQQIVDILGPWEAVFDSVDVDLFGGGLALCDEEKRHKIEEFADHLANCIKQIDLQAWSSG